MDLMPGPYKACSGTYSCRWACQRPAGSTTPSSSRDFHTESHSAQSQESESLPRSTAKARIQLRVSEPACAPDFLIPHKGQPRARVTGSTTTFACACDRPWVRLGLCDETQQAKGGKEGQRSLCRPCTGDVQTMCRPIIDQVWPRTDHVQTMFRACVANDCTTSTAGTPCARLYPHIRA
eukprot:362265-Chlamydomonas_euryale.AAC.6